MAKTEILKLWRQSSDDLDLTEVTVERLRRHFSQTYKLNEDQVEFMVKSSAQSLRTVFESAQQILAGDDSQQAALAKMAHSLKGLLLNMGEQGWADIARAVEFAAKAGESRDYSAPLEEIRTATLAIVEYGQ